MAISLSSPFLYESAIMSLGRDGLNQSMAEVVVVPVEVSVPSDKVGDGLRLTITHVHTLTKHTQREHCYNWMEVQQEMQLEYF